MSGLAQERQAKPPPRPERAMVAPPLLGAPPPPGLEAVAWAELPEALTKAHGALLAKHAAPIGALHALQAGLPPVQQKTAQRVFSQAYKTLGQALDAVPAAARPELLRAGLGALQRLAEAHAHSENLSPAVATALGLVDTQLRLSAARRLALPVEALTAALPRSVEWVEGLQRRLESRSGLGTSLHLGKAMIEQLARTQAGLSSDGFWAVAASVQSFLESPGPRAGLSQEAAGRISKALQASLQAPGPIDAVLARAGELFLADYAQARADLEAQLAQPSGLAGPAAALFEPFNQALQKMVEVHGGTSAGLAEAIYGVRAWVIVQLQRLAARPQGNQRILEKLSPFLTRLAETPLAEAGLRYTQELLNAAAARPDLAYLEGLPEAPTPGAQAILLVEALVLASAGPGQVPAELKAALQPLADNGGLRPLAVALSVQAADRGVGLAPEILRVVADLEAGPADYAAYFARRRNFLAPLAAYGVLGRDADAQHKLASLLAAASPVDPGPGAAQLAALVRTVEQYFPKLSVTDLARDRPEGPGLLTLADQRRGYKIQPNQLLPGLLQTMHRLQLQHRDVEAQQSGVRHCLALAEIFGRLDGAYQLPYQRAQADLQTAWAQPGTLKWAPGPEAALALRGEPSVASFLAAHSALPLELALTAGLHLSPEQLGWLAERIAGARGRDTIRQHRDFIFGAVTANRLDLVEAIRTTALPAKAVSRLIQLVAREYRAQKLPQLPIDKIVAGLQAGGDPAAEIEDESIKASLGNLPLAEVTPTGRAELARCAEAIRNLLEFTQAGKKADGFDCGVMREPFLEVLGAVATDRWPAARYESELGRRMLQILSPEQQAIWRGETVVGAQVERPDPQLVEVGHWALGLRQALQKVRLSHPQLKDLAFDPACEARVAAHLAGQLEALRAAPKGSAEQRALAGAMRPLRDLLAIISLGCRLAEAGGEPQQLLLGLKGALDDAIAPLHRRGFPAAAEVARDLHSLALQIRGPARGGLYAVDEDGLEPLLMSTTNGCIHHTGPRRWANINLAANPNEKILRVYEDDQFKYRACLKILQAKLPDGYEGPVLWVNQANSNAGGGAQHLQLLEDHALQKGKDLGIPVLSSYCQIDKAAARVGRAWAQENVTLQVDDGATGTVFIDYLLGISDVKTARGQAPIYEKQLQCKVVRPA